MNKVENSERANNALRLKQMEQFFGELFDIAICRCRDLHRCNCPREHRVPEAEKRFLRDQRSARRMFVTRRNEGSGMSPSHPAAATSGGSLQSAQQASDSEEQKWQHLTVTVFAEDAGSSTAADLDWQPNDSATGKADMQTLTNTALPLNRFSISNRGVTGILYAYQYIGRISGALEDSTRVIDPKMCGERGTAYGRMKLQT